MDDIRTGQFRKVYLIYGDETYLIREISSRLCAELTHGDTMNTLTVSNRQAVPSEVREFTDTMPFLADRRVVVMEDTGVFSSSDPAFAEWIETLPDTASVVFIEHPAKAKEKDKGDPMSMVSSVDKRTKLFKAVQKEGIAVELNKLEGEARTEWILKEIGRRKVRITKNAFALLVDVLPDAMESAIHEMDKLADYVGENGAIDEKTVETVVTPKLSFQVFKLVEAAVSKDRETAFRLYYDLVALDTNPMGILFNITREILRLNAVASMKKRRCSNTEIASALGVQEFVVRKLAAHTSRIPASFLEGLAEEALELDHAVKSGDLTDSMAVELLLFRMT